MLRRGHVFRAMSLIALFALAGLANSAYVPSFQDVSKEKGLLSFDELEWKKATNNKYWGSTVGDFDRDGKYDLLLSNHGNPIEMYFMKPDGRYEYSHLKLNGRDLHATAAADMDGDGYLELIVNQGGSNGQNVKARPTVFHTNKHQKIDKEVRPGRTQIRDKMGLGGVPMRGRAMMFLDMNADGHLDLLLLNRQNATPTTDNIHIVYQNNGDGTFTVQSDTGIEDVNAKWGQVIDANNDSYPDILFFKYRGLELWLGTGDFRFIDGTGLLGEASNLGHVRCAAEIDVDHDGDLDIVLARAREEIRKQPRDVILQKEEDGYVAKVLTGGLDQGRGNYHVTTGDFNNDGNMDMFFSSMTWFKEPRQADLMYLGDGEGSFTVAPSHGTESLKPDSDGDNANAFDYNMDGWVDLLIGARNESWRLYENRSGKMEESKNAHYLAVRVGEPRGQVAEPTWLRRKALGALVKVWCNGKVFSQRIGSSGQSHSQSYADTLHFGLGECTEVDWIHVEYQGDLVVKRSGPIAVDQVVTMGMYFACPEGMLGSECDEKMSECSSDPCEDGVDCETVELVGDKCVLHNGAMGGSGENMLTNEDFELTRGWLTEGGAEYSDHVASKGSRSMKLPLFFSRVTQLVSLGAETEYELSCNVYGDDVLYKVRRNGAMKWMKISGRSEAIEGSRWWTKSATFKTAGAGFYRVSVGTAMEDASVIDSCTLRAKRSSASCLKLNCPLAA